MTSTDPKQRLLQQKLARAGIQTGSAANSRPQRRTQAGLSGVSIFACIVNGHG